jgi:hypothetical protein
LTPAGISDIVCVFFDTRRRSGGLSDPSYLFQVQACCSLIEINTMDSNGSVTLAAQAMDERVKIESYYRGVEFYYLFLKALTTAQH